MRTFLLETLLIVVGILAALSVDEWRQQREARAHARTALEGIVQELRSNREAVRASLDYHGRKSAELYAYAHPDSAGRHPRPGSFDRGFVAPAQVLSTAWVTARETGVLETLEYDRVLRISKVYAEQDRYELQTVGVSELVYRILLEQGPTGIVSRPMNHASILQSFAWRERGLLKTYDELLAELSSASAMADAIAGRGDGDTDGRAAQNPERP